MSESRLRRSLKKQLGQFMTPVKLSSTIVESIKDLDINSRVLEPSFGDGSFILPLIDVLILKGYDLETILTKIIWGVEIDTSLYNKTCDKIIHKYGNLPKNHNLINADFFETEFDVKFSHIIGNPPFGGTIDYKYQNKLEKLFGQRMGLKIKKETYSFFTIKCIENLQFRGQLNFICSDTFLSIKTMKGLRVYLQKSGFTNVQRLKEFSTETNYPMVIINFQKDIIKDYVMIDDCQVGLNIIELTPNNSWSMNQQYSKYFSKQNLSNFIIASGGLSTGKNEYFVREINNNQIVENYTFEYFQDPITLNNEISKAKLNKLPESKKRQIIEKEKLGITQENVRITLSTPTTITLPNNDYSYYNKATNEIFYSNPKYCIYWKDDGKGVLTFKKNGNWYLHGVGGKNFFKKEGITWQLISKKINPRYLPEGYILDNSSPVAILKDKINKDELFFILGWLTTDLATQLQKKVINHTKNIQNKDIERLPYPFWVDDESKQLIINIVKQVINDKLTGKQFQLDDVLEKLNRLFVYEN